MSRLAALMRRVMTVAWGLVKERPPGVSRWRPLPVRVFLVLLLLVMAVPIVAAYSWFYHLRVEAHRTEALKSLSKKSKIATSLAYKLVFWLGIATDVLPSFVHFGNS